MILPKLKRHPVKEGGEYSHHLTYCKRYWGKTGDYGDSKWPEADKFIEVHKPTWEKQVKRARQKAMLKKTQTEHGDLGEDGGEVDFGENESEMDSDEDEDKMDVSEASSQPPHQQLQMRTLASKKDYHGSCRLLYAKPLPECYPDRNDPILIRAEYTRTYERLKLMHKIPERKYKAVVTGQPGIGNLPLHRLLHG
jgi:hypothetical protein